MVSMETPLSQSSCYKILDSSTWCKLACPESSLWSPGSTEHHIGPPWWAENPSLMATSHVPRGEPVGGTCFALMPDSHRHHDGPTVVVDSRGGRKWHVVEDGVLTGSEFPVCWWFTAGQAVRMVLWLQKQL